MRIIKIDTRGKLRTIYSPAPDEKMAGVVLNYQINKLLVEHDMYKDKIIHGFLPKRSCVTNALQHRSKAYSLSFDLKDFFESVMHNMVPEWMHKGFYDNAPRQGIPSSPSIANYAALSMDGKMVQVANDLGAVYTRYADDMTFSFDNINVRQQLEWEVPLLVSLLNFEVNEKKTHFQSASRGRRIICGIGVDHSIHPTKKSKRKLRAAIHKNKKSHCRGLREWHKLKVPGGYDG